MSNLCYFDLKIPAPRRLVLMRSAAAKSTHPQSWREARAYTLGTYAAAFALLSHGQNDGGPVWYAHRDPDFRGERFADEIAPHLGHRGWLTDPDDNGETARGIVARLSHGRFIAGYYWSGNSERVYFPGVHDDERDAADTADEHARVFAERNCEYNEKIREADEVENKIEETNSALRKALALRNDKRFPDAREEAAEYIAQLRELNERNTQLRTELGL